jgi:uncharacterized protein YciI
MAMELEEFQFVLLRRPATGGAELDEATAQRLQREHLEFYAGLRRAGEVVTNGPMRDQPDEALRGLAIFTAGSVERAREIAARDPLVLAGRLETEVMTWWCPAGTMVRPGRPFTIG